MGARVVVSAGALALLAALLPATVGGAQDEPRGIENFCPPGEVAPSGFTDIAGNPHADAIDCVAFYEIARGTTETTYSPRAQVRRDQMASFIARMIDHFADVFEENFLPDDPEHAFDDVNRDNPHALRVNQLAAVEIVGGFPDGTYRPAATVTRDAMASFINRAIDLITGEDPPLRGERRFTDTAGNPHEENVNGLAAEGIVAGFGDGTYRPRDPVFRDQMASFIARSGDYLSAEAFTSSFFVLMAGEAEVDDSGAEPQFGQGEADAFGIVLVSMNSDEGFLCYEGFADAAGPFVGHHIHEGRMYENGPIVVELDEPDADGEIPLVCQEEDPDVLAEIEADPSSYYVNVHTEDFADGALRGQLESDVMLSRLLWAFEVDDEGNFGQGEEGAEAIGLTMIDLRHEEICVYAQTDATPPFVGFHIHVAPMGANGTIVVNLNDPHPVSRESSTCLDADDLDDEDLDSLEDLVFDRDSYYLNIHTAQHPAGVVRGQIDTEGIIVDLSGEDVVDGGEQDASGTFYGQAGFMSGRVCHYVVTDATPPFVGMHTHEGPAGEDGPIILEHEPPDDETGEVSECFDVELDLLFEVVSDLDGYYLQIHTEDHPDGAVRGQLGDFR